MHKFPLGDATFRSRERMHLCIRCNGFVLSAEASYVFPLSRSDTRNRFIDGKEQRDRKAGRESLNFGGAPLIFLVEAHPWESV